MNLNHDIYFLGLCPEGEMLKSCPMLLFECQVFDVGTRNIVEESIKHCGSLVEEPLYSIFDVVCMRIKW